MKIDFYAEFPEKGDLEKIRLVDFNSRVFIACNSPNEFERYRNQVKKINKKITCAYWPKIKNSYWISPFSSNKDLLDSFNELSKLNYQYLIDLEFPLLKPSLFLKNFFNFRKNKKLIASFLEKHKKRIMAAQYPFTWKIMKIFGLDYNINYEKSPMFYSSGMPNFVKNSIKKQLLGIKNKKNYTIGLGTICKGVFENETNLPPSKLELDLSFVKEAGFNRAVIFGLAGLNKEYLKVIRKYL